MWRCGTVIGEFAGWSESGTLVGGGYLVVAETYRRSRSSACALALVPASHQLLIPAVNVNGISFAGGNALSGAVRDGTVL